MTYITLHNRLKSVVFAIVFVTTFAYGQELQDSIMVGNVAVLDAFYETPLEEANVSILEPDSSSVLVPLMKYWKGPKSFYAKAPFRKEYVIRIVAENYPLTYQRITVTKKPNGFVSPEKAIYLWQEPTKKLNEVSVTASRVLMVMKGDTIEYNAAAFRLAEGSMLDRLVSALPGAKLDDDGRITVNGEFVSSLMVNGRDFFKGDPKIALHNLPAYTVSKVQVYRRNEEAMADGRTQLTQAEKEESPLVMDVRLKKEYARGWISNYEVGGGHNLHGGGWKWMWRLFAMRYTNHSSFAVFGGSNNLNDPMEVGGKGEWHRAEVTDGLRTTHSGGLSYALDPKESPWHFNTDLKVTNQRSASQVHSLSERYYPTVTSRAVSNLDSRMYPTDFKWNGKVRFQPKGYGLYIEPKVTFRHEKGNDRMHNDEWNSEVDSLYVRDRNTQRLSRVWNVGGWIGGSYNLGHINKVKLDFYGGYNHRTLNRFTDDNLSYFTPVSPGYHKLYDITTPLKDYNYLVKASYDNYEGITARPYKSPGKSYISYWFRLLLNLVYSYEQHYSTERQTMFEASDDEMTPSVNPIREWIINAENSYHTTYLDRTHFFGIRFGLYMGNIYVSLAPDVKIFNRKASYIRVAAQRRLSCTDALFKPQIKLTWSKDDCPHSFSAFAKFDEELPQMYYLLDFVDTSNPMNVMAGNPNLKKSREQWYHASYELNIDKYSQMFRLNGGYISQSNKVGIAYIYNESTGVTTCLPMNVNGNHQWYVRSNYSISIGGRGNWSISNDLSMHAARSVDFASAGNVPELSAVRNTRINEELRVDYRINGIHVGVKGSINWTRQHSEQGLFGLMKYGSGGYGVTFSMPGAWGISVDTDLMAYNRFGYGDPAMNTTDWVWNLQLQKSFGKANCFTLKATGFDILHQLSTVRREVNAQGYTETRYNSMPSYVMLSLFYRLDIKPKRIGDK